VVAVKFDSLGVVQWTRAYEAGGGTESDPFIQPTDDGGYIMAAVTNSFGVGSNQLWIVKLDASGVITWDLGVGGAGSELDSVVREIPGPSGGYIVGCRTNSFPGGSNVVWILKISDAGGVVWQETISDGVGHLFEDIQPTMDGGFIVGSIWTDIYLTKLTSTGVISWDKSYGGGGNEGLGSVLELPSGEFLVSGQTNSFGAGLGDVWLLNLPAGSCLLTVQTRVCRPPPLPTLLTQPPLPHQHRLL